MECHLGATSTPLISILDLMMNMKYLVLLPLTAVLSACGGGSDSTNSSNPHGAGGLFFGAYAETAGGTDTDSSVGGMYLQLPSKDADFNGRMSFQYQDCQSTNALAISGEKILKQLSVAKIEGQLDLVNSSDPKVIFSFAGEFTNGNAYQGKYNRIGALTTSNENRTAAGCHSYVLANKGQWAAWPQNTNAPSTFLISNSGNMVQWPVLPNMSKTVVMFLDPAKLNTAGANAFVLQRTVSGIPATTAAPLGSAGKTYRVVVQVFDANNGVIAYDDALLTF